MSEEVVKCPLQIFFPKLDFQRTRDVQRIVEINGSFGHFLVCDAVNHIKQLVIVLKLV
jgi:hypothetical protein